MHSYLVRRVSTLALAVGGIAILAACGEDERVEAVDSGMSRDSVITMLAREGRTDLGLDSMPNVYWRETYFIAGKNHEVLYFHPEGKKAEKGADTAYAELTPVVMVENRMVGKGWDYWDSLSKANNIPLKKRED